MARILVVDDDANNRLLLLTVLGHAGHVVMEAATGEGALQLAVSAVPELIVVDLSLPDVSGVDVIRRLRRDERTKGAVIAVYTASRLSPAIEEVVDLYGVDGAIPKPGHPQQILAAVGALLRSAAAR